MASRWHQVIAAAAAIVAAAGIVTVAAHEGRSECDRVRDRLLEIVPHTDGPTQRWEDISTLQENMAEGLRMQAEYRRRGCLPALPEPATTSTTAPAGSGSSESASTAVRAACRHFYGYDPADVDRQLTEVELVERCDAPPVEWRSGCYSDRPPAFVTGDGGCAQLGGYLAVWHGEQAFAEGRVFRVGADVWTVIPESD